ncbi:serine/threonine protein kinase [Variovorax sp. W1I1]|uniref:protein kinase domain-containing protein n=1 Tax=Variovorax sp. W1I1 TaxID=3042309 RepID=UPI002789F16E|nr:hypothetical protein [Variovorax sp. W1I1]MDQ0612240.1 serine/threonine protein kinase [Variovorax sp. W1I1]
MTQSPPLLPRDTLLGRSIKGGWVVTEKLEKKAGDSGGNFGTGYTARRGEGELAFVKVIDYVRAMRSGDAAAELSKLTREFQFEREILEYCTSRGLSKVLRFYGHDEFFADGSDDPMMKVSCLIMEAGEKDLRRLVNTDGAGTRAGCAWNLFIISDIALAISQLHANGIAHHDIKPSNVIATKTEGVAFLKRSGKPQPQEAAPAPDGGIKARQEVKVGDLGRVLRKDKDGPFNGYGFAGDERYQPLESFYGHVPTTGWVDARDAADAYMLGSIMVYLFTGVSLQQLLVKYVPEQFAPGTWQGDYDQALVTVLNDATTRALHDMLRPTLPEEYVDAIMGITQCLTHPDPTLRGDLKARSQHGRSVGLDRIHQRLHLLARRCAADERGRLAA